MTYTWESIGDVAGLVLFDQGQQTYSCGQGLRQRYATRGPEAEIVAPGMVQILKQVLRFSKSIVNLLWVASELSNPLRGPICLFVCIWPGSGAWLHTLVLRSSWIRPR